jgi:hypothetical protein
LKPDDRTKHPERIHAMDALLVSFDRHEVCSVMDVLYEDVKAKLDAATKTMADLDAEKKKQEKWLQEREQDIGERFKHVDKVGKLHDALAAEEEGAIGKWREFLDTYEAGRRSNRIAYARHASHLAQIERYLKEPEQHLELLRPILKAREWRPELLPFKERLGLRVTFEFVDMPLKDGIKELSLITGMPLECDAEAESAATPITLRVQDMELELSLKWVARLAELDLTIDREKAKLFIGKKAPALPDVEEKPQDESPQQRKPTRRNSAAATSA